VETDSKFVFIVRQADSNTGRQKILINFLKFILMKSSPFFSKYLAKNVSSLLEVYHKRQNSTRRKVDRFESGT